MTENKTIGVYYVDTTDLEGWTDETLTAALRSQLGEIGIEVEVGNSINNPIFFEIVDEDNIREQVQYIVEKVVTQ